MALAGSNIPELQRMTWSPGPGLESPVLAVGPNLSERRGEQFVSCFGVEINACVTTCGENRPGWCTQLAGSAAVIPRGAELICPRAGNSCCAVSGTELLQSWRWEALMLSSSRKAPAQAQLIACPRVHSWFTLPALGGRGGLCRVHSRA